MDGKVINLEAITQGLSSPRADAGDRLKPALDGSRFHDRGRLQSSEVTRAFASVIRADSLAPRCDVPTPDEVVLEPDVDVLGVDVQIVRGVD